MKPISIYVFPVFIAVIVFLVFISDKVKTEDDIHPGRKALTGRVLQYGIYELVREGKLVESKVTTTGKAISRPTIQQVEQTDRIPVKRDVYFSYQYRLSNFPTTKPVVNLKRVLKHPQITLPDGTVRTGSEYMIKGRVKRGEVFAFDGYAFSEDYELVEGDWIFQIWFEGQKLVEQKFTSYKVDAENG